MRLRPGYAIHHQQARSPGRIETGSSRRGGRDPTAQRSYCGRVSLLSSFLHRRPYFDADIARRTTHTQEAGRLGLCDTALRSLGPCKGRLAVLAPGAAPGRSK